MGAPQSKQVFISALEPSADAHCAHLIRAAAELTEGPSSHWPGADNKHIPLPEKPAVRWTGLGGPKMAAAGCRLLENPVGRAAMLYNVLGQLGYYRNLLKTAVEYLKNNPVDLLVVCDSPAFHFHLAKAAKRLGIPVLFYVAPQLWAWAPWRICKLRRCCDRLACILPFEKEWFTRRGVRTDFVGNPLQPFPLVVYYAAAVLGNRSRGRSRCSRLVHRLRIGAVHFVFRVLMQLQAPKDALYGLGVLAVG